VLIIASKDTVSGFKRLGIIIIDVANRPRIDYNSRARIARIV
jgi:vacuolar-type H+-ATPase subunit F/Vma7